MAYGFDLICCAVGVVPFSRCRKAGEIWGHHFPVLCVLVPLGAPFYLRLAAIEPCVATWRNNPRVSEALFYRINSWAFISSLNEFIMCNARSELEAGKSGFWNSRPVAIFELTYKLGIFVVFSTLSFWSCCHFDVVRFNEARSVSATLLGAVARTYCSPLQLRTMLWRLFIVTKYPTMAQRTIGKLRKLVTTGNEDGATTSERTGTRTRTALSDRVGAPPAADQRIGRKER